MGTDERQVSNNELLNEIRNLKTDFAAALAAEVNKLKADFDQQLKETHSQFAAKVVHLEEKVNLLADQLIHLQAHGRRLNIIVNNAEETKNENTEEVVKEIFVKKLHIPELEVSKMMFRDCHRLPASNKSKSESGDPRRPIIVAFIQQIHRNSVMMKVEKLRNTGLSIKTDLPKAWDIQRNELLILRRSLINEGKYARVVERSYKPVLQIKKGDKWLNYK